jgi:hypothetical protein
MDRQGNLSRTEAANCRRSAVARRDDRGVIALEPDDLQSVRRGPIDLQTETSRDLIEFMMHRLALRQGSFDVPMGSGGPIVEVDETYIGRQAGHTKGKRRGHMNAVLTPVERGGKSRTKASSRSVLGVNDFQRAEIAAAGIKGKRLTYRRADSIRKAEAHYEETRT